MAILTQLDVPGKPELWESLGFEVSSGSFVVGRVRMVCGASGASWAFDSLASEGSKLGVPTAEAPAPDGGVAQPNGDVVHPNCIDRIDHVVYAVPDLDEAVGALGDALDMEPTRRFHPRGPGGPEMAFYRVGDGFIEVVASGRPAALWGIAFSTPDLDACVAAVRDAGGPIGDPKPAVQGGRIASVWKEHVGWGVAVMEPPE
jgi:catechol 2,3-dioxygenase-like lactoylglutathione lyase family enzyme